ncbi:MAG TPA: HAD-IIB family hydrolase [Candidatus Dojkabacteria bacterium]|nr:HAD-IIB family hydrolase [Candidatus Dojkabacteria bacterium]
MKKLLIFDYDGTLAKPVSKPSKKILDEIARLLQGNYIAVMSGGRTIEQLNELLIRKIPLKKTSLLKNLYLCPLHGNRIYKWNNKEYRLIYSANDMTSEEMIYIFNILSEIDWNSFNLGEITKERIKYKGHVVSIDFLGDSASNKEKEEWDPDKKRRNVIKEDIDKLLKYRFDVYATGRSTIDIVDKGNTKADNTRKLAKMLGISLKNVVFTGDEFGKHGNDFPLLELDDIQINITKGPEETLAFLKKL